MMDSIRQRVLTNWSFSRFLRLGIGLYMLFWGIQAAEWPAGIFSVLFIFMAVSNTGCCGAQGCGVPGNIIKKPSDTEIDYEETKSKEKI